MQAKPPRVLKNRSLTVERAEKFVSKVYFKDVNLYGRLYGETSPVNLSVYSVPDLQRPLYSQVLEEAVFTPAKIGQSFGPSWSTHWFKVEIEIPKEWEGKEVHLLWDSDSEACVWEDGVPQQGLTGGSIHDVDRRAEYILTRTAKHEKRILWVEMACNGMFGAGSGGMIMAPEPNRHFTLKQAEIAVFNRDVWELLWDFTVICDMAKHLPSDSARGAQALWVANEIVNTCYPDDPSTYPKARAIAAKFFADHNGDSVHEVSAIGHCHIDTAWLWPYDETKRKIARSWATQIRYMAMPEYSDYKFVASQAQQHEWMKELYPRLFEELQAWAAKGRFVPTGGTWVEMDCNIPSGEAFVRQFLYGQRFYKEAYGQYCTEFWLPDTFGYSAQLPQIIQSAGMRFFLTQKLSWNLFNKFPHSTFVWEGIDGSKVLAHFPPADTYNAHCTVEEFHKSTKNFKESERSKHFLCVYGHGDGGGGPQMEMLERLKRFRDLDGLPKVQLQTPYEFFLKAEEDQDKYLTWIGELFFEMHNGTYTSQAATKAGNRYSEFLLHDVELLAALVSASSNDWSETSYPQQELLRLWKLVLLNQFHDVLPGSSIGMVYDDAAKIYAEVKESGEKLLQNALQGLNAHLLDGNDKEKERATKKQRTEKGEAVLTVNTVDATRVEVVEVPGATSPSLQTSHNSHPLYVVRTPGVGYSITDLSETVPVEHPVSVTVTSASQVKRKRVGDGMEMEEEEEEGSDKLFVLENEFVRVQILPDGHIVSIWDKKEEREAIDASAAAYGNNFALFDDIPLFWDAWDTMFYAQQKTHRTYLNTSMEVLEKGPLRAVLLLKVKLSAHSHLEQRISLSALSARLDFETTVDWHENRKFLKVEFPLNVRSPVATYEIQFGHLQRPTHANNSWDMAKFEVVGHKWADLSEYGYGVALLNNNKYGYSCHDNVMRLSLLRAPKQPDTECDMGVHHFKYALLPHAGTFQEAGVIQHGYNFNVPLHVSLVNTSGSSSASFFSVNRKGIIIDTVKKAEDSNAIIVRLYEAFGGSAKAKLLSTLPIRRAVVTNILEEDGEELQWNNGAELSFTPFKFHSVKLFL